MHKLKILIVQPEKNQFVNMIYILICTTNYLEFKKFTN